jgi:hypothetical protein
MNEEDRAKLAANPPRSRVRRFILITGVNINYISRSLLTGSWLPLVGKTASSRRGFGSGQHHPKHNNGFKAVQSQIMSPGIVYKPLLAVGISEPHFDFSFKYGNAVTRSLAAP